MLNEVSDVRDSTLSGTVCIIIISPSAPLISLKKTAHLCGICLESASPTASQVLISLINYVASQTASENTSKTGIMCLVGLQFSVSQLNFQWLPGTFCWMYSLNTSLHLMGTIHKDVQQFTIGKNSIWAKVPLMKSQGIQCVLSWSINRKASALQYIGMRRL